MVDRALFTRDAPPTSIGLPYITLIVSFFVSFMVVLVVGLFVLRKYNARNYYGNDQGFDHVRLSSSSEDEPPAGVWPSISSDTL